jgi:MarR family transcriptional regulator, organic hydroperoxide resistance regulator
VKQIRDFVGFQLVRVCRAHRQRADEKLSKLGLHVGQEMMLLQLWVEDGLTQSQLAQYANVELPTMTKMVQRMEHAGLVVRRPDPEDARISRVYLTERGRSLEQPVLRAWTQLEERTLAGLTQVEQMLLRRMLLQIDTNLSDQ